MQPAIISLVLATAAHLTTASPLSRRQGVARSSGPAAVSFVGSTTAYQPRQADASVAGAAGENAGQGKRNGKGKRQGKGNGQNPGAGGAIPASLIPTFGIVAGAGKDRIQVGSCDGFANGNFVPVPCTCPPPRDEFIAKLNQAVRDGRVLDQAIEFNTDPADTSVGAQQRRATAAIVVLQSFSGDKGVGCPGSSYPNIVSQQKTGQIDTKVFQFGQ